MGGSGMNIIEALKLLQDGKKIYHENMPYVIYQLIDQSLKMYHKEDNYDYFILLDVDMNILAIDCKRMMDGWEQVTQPIPIFFTKAITFYKDGKTIKRIGKDKHFNKNTNKLFISLEDIEAKDWEVVE
jgi:hypothetical protein